jgi:hypothetical protein
MTTLEEMFLTANLADPTARSTLADAMDEAGRAHEAALLRGQEPLVRACGRVWTIEGARRKLEELIQLTLNGTITSAEAKRQSEELQRALKAVAGQVPPATETTRALAENLARALGRVAKGPGRQTAASQPPERIRVPAPQDPPRPERKPKKKGK